MKRHVLIKMLAALLVVAVVTGSLLAFQFSPSDGEGEQNAVAAMKQDLVDAIDGGASLSYRVESYRRDRQMLGLTTVDYPDRIVIEGVLSVDDTGNMVLTTREYTMDGRLLSSGTVVNGVHTLQAAGTSETFTYTGLGSGTGNGTAKITGFVEGQFNSAQRFESDGRTRLPNEHIDGREVKVFEASSATTQVGGRYKSVAYVPVDNPHLLESKSYKLVDGQELLVRQTKWLSVATE